MNQQMSLFQLTHVKYNKKQYLSVFSCCHNLFSGPWTALVICVPCKLCEIHLSQQTQSDVVISIISLR